mmetsp:Transcript_1073/g.1399  ORF Transcript_1073/g.1399 Transcript_1073/m.1399 type:complete len:243 (+) Transcript_1073:237-965(+)|eukprot:CAMPEP_0117753682 /NCGR_PEP_ID=MMETSP0947-20121206/12381_1 /TAXON_ID=44440 /ORGANISM="Chattonella subsalsa, Strain CCMP2191" /LENGTH=242 /DNA_ID=CAMNT_0005572631 /DNA_START=291 /DNA_END=1019 /DNA_ORIENTATION=+
MSGERVLNGYGIRTSTLSASNIGYKGDQSQKLDWRDQPHVKHDLQTQLQRQKQVHPSRKELYMQTGYPKTMQRLQQGEIRRRQTPHILKEATRPLTTSAVDLRQQHMMVPKSASTDAFHRSLREETGFNKAKARQYKQQSFQSSVKHLARQYGPGLGMPPGEKPPIFPVGATHVANLCIDKKIVGSDPRKPVPYMNPPLRWLGDEKGWENNRGLPTPEYGGKDGEIKAWPAHPRQRARPLFT